MFATILGIFFLSIQIKPSNLFILHESQLSAGYCREALIMTNEMRERL
jgi:hypothetical protein